MSIRGLRIFVIAVTLMMVGEASGQDPDLQDSLIIGNLSGTIIPVGLNREIVLPVWIKTDDSVTFFHTPLATDDDYIAMRLGGDLYEPLSLWDDASFLAPNPNSPSFGLTTQSILGFAYLFDPRDPQNFLYTNYQWWHVADFHIRTSSDTTVIGDTICLSEGFNPANGGLLWGIPDGVTQIIPAAIYPCLYFTVNTPPEFTQPGPGAEFLVNNEFPLRFPVEANDPDNHMISINLDFSLTGAQLDAVDISPGHSLYMFNWTPGIQDTGQFIATFTADDNHGGVVDLDVAINATPVILQVEEVSAFPCFEVAVPVNLINMGVSSYIGGFDIYLQYRNPELIDFVDVERAPRVDSWDYFHASLGDTSTLRIVGISDLSGTGDAIVPGDEPIAYLNFEITCDSSYIGQLAPINFIYGDDNDNALSDTTGYLLIHADVDSGWVQSLDPSNVEIGDINLNGYPWEISDAVLLANHLLRPEEFPFNYIQMLASDTNQDGFPATMPDLIYLLNVINGTISPPRIDYDEQIYARLSAESDPSDDRRLTFRYDSPVPAGGILMRLDHGSTRVISVSSETGMNLRSSDEDGILSILLFDFGGGLISPGSEILELQLSGRSVPAISELQISDRYGNFIPVQKEMVPYVPEKFMLIGAYPNPFNSSVSIRFSLPEKSNVTVSIYNVLGQMVKSINCEDMPSGDHYIEWDATDDSGVKVSSGIYIYRLTAGKYEAASRITLLK